MTELPTRVRSGLRPDSEAQRGGDASMVPTGVTLAGRLVVVGLVCLAAAGRLEAAPYYTATYVGPANDYMQQSGTIMNLQAGISYPFATTTTPITDADLQNRPSGTMLQGHDYPEMIPYSMDVQAINSSGTAIGAIPVGGGLSDPWEIQALGYAVRSADGQYSPFTTLIPNNNQRRPGELFLSQSNQILIVSDGYSGSGAGTSLFDVKTGVTTPITQLVSSTFARQYPLLRGMGIDDRGDILAEAISPNNSNYPGYLYIFTPPALSAPTATPEPSSLLIFGLIAGAMGLRTMLRDFQERRRR